MRKTIEYQYIVLLLLILGLTMICGCYDSAVSGDDDDTDEFVVKCNNTAIIRGKIVGTGITSNSELRKQILIQTVQNVTGIEIWSGYLTRESSTAKGCDYMIQLYNTSSKYIGFVKMTGMNYVDASGNTLGSDSVNFNYVTGCVGQYSGIFTNSCICAGDFGYIVGVDTFAFDKVAAIRCSTITWDSDFEPVVSIRMIPQSYGIAGQVLSVQVTNKGTTAGYVTAFSTAIVLDVNKIPLLWSFFDNGTYIAPGASGLFGASVTFSGTGRYIYASTDFADDSVSVEDKTIEMSSLHMQKKQLERSRNLREFSSQERYRQMRRL